MKTARTQHRSSRNPAANSRRPRTRNKRRELCDRWSVPRYWESGNARKAILLAGTQKVAALGGYVDGECEGTKNKVNSISHKKLILNSPLTQSPIA